MKRPSHFSPLQEINLGPHQAGDELRQTRQVFGLPQDFADPGLERVGPDLIGFRSE